uniref:Uncharacterized protein AlNc14C1G196 n=1 Tax=Albugo laibachii Nc14 TaxID=890382 RepID=F0VZ55_9STRA|nr:conserved hypothetical protein [Albugo laibachii Nc14]|eukprot:CCA14070.1 conserved hypothetical protein [Albugo laibachii Nc14]
MEFFPTELKKTPHPLIAALGGTDYQAKIISHISAINEDYVPKLHFTALPVDHRFSAKKELREKHGTLLNQTQRDFEGYRVQGILKSHWLKKHHDILPSVVLFFEAFDPRWNQKDWLDQEAKLRAQVESLRKTLSSRECRVILLLIQQLDDTGLTPSNITEERLSGLRKRLETDSKGLILLRSRDITRGSQLLLKLEFMIRTFALDYYKLQAKRVKRYRKVLNKFGTFQAIQVRHSFKIAHYYEFRRYTTKVLQHYENAYRSIVSYSQKEVEARVHGSAGISLVQIKTMAEYINFKLCYHLIFSTNNMKAALDQFHRHIRAFLELHGDPTCLYEHWKWVSRQYHLIAQLLSEATSLRGTLSSSGLDSPVYKEPYLYYSVAAKYATYRRKSAAKLLGLTASTAAQPLNDFVVLSPTFVGGDPIVSLVNPNPPNTLNLVIKYRQALERSTPHAKQTIQLLEKALHHVAVHVSEQKSSRNRLKTRLLVHIGSENLAAQDYERARLELDKAKALYVTEHWWSLAAQVLKQLLICSFHQADTLGFIDISLQLLSSVMKKHVLPKERQYVQEKLFIAWEDATKLRGPFAARGLDCIPQQSHEVILSLSHRVFDISVKFSRVAACIREQASVRVSIQSHFPGPIVLSKVTIFFSDARYNTIVTHDEHAMELSDRAAHLMENAAFRLSLMFGSGASKEFGIPLQIRKGEPILQYLGMKIFIDRMRGSSSDERPALVFCTSDLMKQPVMLKAIKPYLLEGRVPLMGKGPGSPSFARRKTFLDAADSIDSVSAKTNSLSLFEKDYNLHIHHGQSLLVTSQRARAKLEIITSQPVLAGDFKVQEFVLRSNEDSIGEAFYTLKSDPAPESDAFEDAFFFEMSSEGLRPLMLDASCQPKEEFSLKDIGAFCEQRFRIVVRSTKAAITNVSIQLTYLTKLRVVNKLEEHFPLTCLDPFKVDGVLHPHTSQSAPQREQLEAVSGKQTTFLGALVCQSAEPLGIKSIGCHKSSSCMEHTFISGDCPAGEVVSSGDVRDFILQLFSADSVEDAPLGRLEVTWERLKSDRDDGIPSNVVTTHLTLPAISFCKVPVMVSIDVPQCATMGLPVCLSLKLKNQECKVQSVRVRTVQVSPDFLVEGRTNTVIDLLPWDDICFQLSLTPLKLGPLRLPSLELKLGASDTALLNSDEQFELYVVPPAQMA